MGCNGSYALDAKHDDTVDAGESVGPISVGALDLASLSSLHRADAAKGGMPDWKTKKLESYIGRNLTSRIASQDLADLCAMSLSHFQRVFHQSFGLTPRSYVIEQRLRLARRLLLETDWSIKFIALECGMADQAHLTKAFKKEWNTTPNALRREHSAAQAQQAQRHAQMSKAACSRFKGPNSEFVLCAPG